MFTNTGCKRLVDYYFVVSCSDRGKESTKKRLSNQSLAVTPHDKDARHALFALKPKIVDRYPTRNYGDTPLLQWVARASMPRGVRARTRPPAPRYFTFTGWNIDGSKLYGACLEVFEKMDIRGQRQPVYVPKTLGFMSHYPYFYAFDVFLRCLWHVIPKKLIRLEDLLMHYFYDIPAPLPKKKIAYDLGKMKVLLACRNEFDVPIMELPIETPFTQLSPDRMVMIIKLLLLEHRIVFVCGMVHELTPVCELFASLLFPLRWRHLFIPLLCHPAALKNIKEYKEPFLVGLPRFLYVRPAISQNMPPETCIVFLDRNEITDEHQAPIPEEFVPSLPRPLEENLRDSVHALSRVLTMQEGTVSRDVILQAFRTMFAVVTKLLYISANFIDSGHGKKGSRKHSFVSRFQRTNMFKSFKEYYGRIHPEDPQLKQIYPFFKQNEALGKHFARRSHSNSWTNGFDQSIYSRDAFRVNADVIQRVEKQFAKKRADLVQSNRNKKFTLPKEFELLPEVKDFLKRHVFGHSSKKPTRSSRKQLPSANPKKSTKQIHQKEKNLKRTVHTKPNGNETPINGKYSDHKKREQNGISKPKPGGKSGKANAKKPVSSKAVSEWEKTESVDDVIGKASNVTFGSKRPRPSNTSKPNGSGTVMDVDDDGSNGDNESGSSSTDTDSDSRTSSSGTGDTDDSSTSSDEDSSTDDSDWGEEDDMEDIHDEREDRYAEQRQRRRFRNLNEFQLKDAVIKGFKDSQKHHNKLLENVQEINADVGHDWFDEKLIKTWQNFSKKKKKS